MGRNWMQSSSAFHLIKCLFMYTGANYVAQSRDLTHIRVDPAALTSGQSK